VDNLTSMRNIKVTKALPYNVPEIEDITDQLPKHRSYTWETMPTRTVNGKPISGLRRYEDINTIVIHHTASEAPLVNQANYHINAHGWPGLSYHIAISNGRIYQCNDLLAFTYHVANNNSYTIGIAVNGDLSKREMTSLERELLYAAILTVKGLFPIKQILGHNELNNTSCPNASMNRIREDIKTLEVKIERAKSVQARRERATSVLNQVQYMYGLIGSDDGTEEWSLSWFEVFYDFLKSKNMM
jgi:hypothetical protein